MKSVIITGPTGTIGIALIERCIQEKVKVYAVCKPDSLRIKNIPVSPYVQVILCDLNDMKSLPKLINEQCTIFYHFAWAGTVGETRNDFLLQISNIQYTINAVEAAKGLGCNTFIGAGSQAEYGRVEGVLEPSTAVNPENGYGMAKLCAGTMSRELCQKYGIKHIWTRILSVYGPYDGEDTMIISAMKSFQHGKSPAFTKGEQQWDYLYSKDAGNIMYLLGLYGKNQKIYCLGSGKSMSLSTYINTLGKRVNPSVRIRIGELPYSEKQVMYLCADIKDIEKDLGYKIQYSFDAGIKETYKWFLKEIRNEKN